VTVSYKILKPFNKSAEETIEGFDRA